MLLGLDTSTHMVGLALYDGVQVVSESVWHSRDYHTVELAPAVVEILSRASLKTGDLQALGVALGPGSFTGLRIGLALVKGLALARRLPIAGIPSLDILAAAQPVQGERLAAALRVGRGRLAVGWYIPKGVGWRADGSIEIMTAEALSERIETPTQVCGEFNEEEQRLLARKRKIVTLASPAHSLRRPAVLAELAWQRWKAGKADDPYTLAPIYVHFSDLVPG